MNAITLCFWSESEAAQTSDRMILNSNCPVLGNIGVELFLQPHALHEGACFRIDKALGQPLMHGI